MKKAVLDSSVLVSAFLTPGGTSAALLVRARHGAFSLACSTEILDETARALLRSKNRDRYRYEPETVRRFCALLTTLAELVHDLPDLTGVVPLDSKDDMVVATAVAAGADYLVTGDRRHLISLGQYERICIVTPRLFLDELG